MEKRTEVLTIFLVLALIALALMQFQISKYGSLSGFITYNPNETTSISVSLVSPSDGHLSNVATQKFTCSYNVNYPADKLIFSILNEEEILHEEESSSLNVGSETQAEFNYVFEQGGEYEWECGIDYGNDIYYSERWTFIYDGGTTTVVLDSPENGVTLEHSLVQFEFSVEEFSSGRCSLWVDNKPTESFEVSGSRNYKFDDIFAAGTHTWKVLCEDSFENEGESEERTFTINTPPPTEEVVEVEETSESEEPDLSPETGFRIEASSDSQVEEKGIFSKAFEPLKNKPVIFIFILLAVAGIFIFMFIKFWKKKHDFSHKLR